MYEDAIQVLEEVITPACAGFALPVRRSDTLAKSGEITDQIFRELRDSDLVIADLTSGNPNVMYELGLRHTTGKLTIQLGEHGKLPFDVSAIRTILFKRSETGLIDARKRLAEAISVGLADGGDPVTATRLWKEKFNGDDVERSAGETLKTFEEDELGFLEKLVNAEKAMPELSQALAGVTTATRQIGELTGEAARLTNEINDRKGTQSEKLLIAERLASQLEEPALTLEESVNVYAAVVDLLSPGIIYLLEQTASSADSQQLEAEQFREKMRAMISAADSNMKPISAMKTASIKAGQATRSLRRINNRIAATLQIYIDTTKKILLWQSHMPTTAASSK